jgi:hypothetical protein
MALVDPITPEEKEKAATVLERVRQLVACDEEIKVEEYTQLEHRKGGAYVWVSVCAFVDWNRDHDD